ncbi:MAG: ribonucleoside triphosphate reductase [Deltaproteobacteria bacterium]|jgi:ribonucleoside-triphosphate reductase|nr:ribonucleoside triphosphate reductase [Deltaproteobacteria bacterium]
MLSSRPAFTNFRKRDGRVVAFVPEKITLAIAKAGDATKEFGLQVAADLTTQAIREALKKFPGDTLEVESIQDIVEDVLIDCRYKATAKAYILYREHRAQVRAVSQIEDDLMSVYLDGRDWRIRENSNMPFSLQGMNCYVSAAASKRYWLYKVYTDKIREAHRNGDFHIHDLNLLAVYCVGWDLSDLLKVGFKGVAGNVESSAPKHLRTALGQLYNFFYSLQGESAGAQAVSNFDTLLAPFIRYDNLNYAQVYQAMQEFIFNLNVPTRVGFQTPFTNISFDLTPPSYLKDSPVIVAGQYQKEVYGEFQEEMDLINKIFAEVMMSGDSKGRIFTFPIPTYGIVKDFNWDNPVLDSVWKMTGRYGIPYFSNYVNSDLDPEEARSMCCHLILDTRELRSKGGGLFGSNPLTGSVGVVTLNIPRLGYESTSKAEFFERLDNLTELACDSLILKRKALENFTENGLYPYSKFYLRDIKQKTGKYWSNHFSTVGLTGVNEACLNFLKKDISTEEGREFALEILDHIRKNLSAYQEKTGAFFNLEATPAEGTSHGLAKMDFARHRDMIFANGRYAGKSSADLEKFKPYYTNSTHLPVNHTTDLFSALDHQDDLQSRYTGGTVLHGYVGEQITDPEVVKSLVRKITSNYKLPYFTLTPTFSVCENDGYLVGEQHVCPKCQSPADVYSRVVGYYRPISRWNDGKQTEFKMRTTYVGLNNLHDTKVKLEEQKAQPDSQPDSQLDAQPVIDHSQPASLNEAKATLVRDSSRAHRRSDQSVHGGLSL